MTDPPFRARRVEFTDFDGEVFMIVPLAAGGWRAYVDGLPHDYRDAPTADEAAELLRQHLREAFE